MRGYSVHPAPWCGMASARCVEPQTQRTCRRMSRNKSGMGSHQSSNMGKDEWLTPPEILRALGPFDLDPCAPIIRPWELAALHYTTKENGLLKSWHGRVYCNPPYGKEAEQWLARCADHGNAIALIFARTETKTWIENVWKRADGILFLFGRLHFHHSDGARAKANSGAPSALVAYGTANATCLRSLDLPGHFVPLEPRKNSFHRNSENVSNLFFLEGETSGKVRV